MSASSWFSWCHGRTHYIKRERLLMQALLKIADMPVIFPGRLRSEDTIARAFEIGAVDYVVKPFSPTVLAARV